MSHGHHEILIPARRPTGLDGLRATPLPSRRTYKITVIEIVGLMVVMMLLLQARSLLGGQDAAWMGLIIVAVLSNSYLLGYKPAVEDWRLVLADGFFELHQRTAVEERRVVDGRWDDLEVEVEGNVLVLRIPAGNLPLHTRLSPEGLEAIREEISGVRAGTKPSPVTAAAAAGNVGLNSE
jgi:hypothetical protein